MEVTWLNYGPRSRLSNVQYLVNGRFVGRGTDGLDAIAAILEAAPSGRLVLIYPEPLVEQEWEEVRGCGPVFFGHGRARDAVPLHLVEGYEHGLMLIGKRRNHIIRYLAGPPGMLTIDGQDCAADIDHVLKAYSLGPAGKALGEQDGN